MWFIEPWAKRGAALSQDQIVGTMRREFAAIQEAWWSVLVPPSIRGLGQAGGFQMMIEDRASLGLDELQNAVSELIRRLRPSLGIQRLATTFSARSPQILSGHRPDQGRIPGSADQRRVRHPAVLPGLVFRQPVQQVQPGVPGLYAGGCALSPESGRHQETCTCGTTEAKWCRSGHFSRSGTPSVRSW